MGQVTQEQWVSNIQTDLVSQLSENTKALPQGFNKDRFVLNCITVIQDMLRDNKKRDALQKVDLKSIPICLLKGAFLGLDFFNGECYAIPYGTNMQFQTDYKGEIKLCKRYSKNPIKDIFAKVVREGDFFEEEVSAGVQNVVYRPKPFNNGDKLGAFAIVVFKDGSMMYDTMSKEEIEHTRSTYSKAQNSQAWKESSGEMYKKTVLRRLCKLIDLDFDTMEQMRAYEDGGDAVFENAIPNKQGKQIVLPGETEVVDALGGTTQAIEEKPQPQSIPQTIPQQQRQPELVYAGTVEPEPYMDQGFMDPDVIENMDTPFK